MGKREEELIMKIEKDPYAGIPNNDRGKLGPFVWGTPIRMGATPKQIWEAVKTRDTSKIAYVPKVEKR